MASTHKVKIVARLRPRLNGELDDESVKVCHSGDSTGGGGSFISVVNPRDPSQVFKFPFSSCYDQSATQEEIFRNDVRPMIDVVYSGVTVTIFAYGVTSSGKTHTMQGTRPDPGVIPRVVRSMFAKKAEYAHLSVDLTVSYMEIYKDEVYDLLVNRENAPKLPVRENDVGVVFVANLTSETISGVDEFDAIYSRATKHRSVGATNLNHASSRSHAVLTIQVSMSDPVHNKILTGKINLVDLAGSENNKLTGNDASRMAESAAINKSLSVLGQVVHALNQGAPRIPYRNSKLTRILQDALGGSSVGLLICNLAPGIKFRQDTLNTLNFAVRTKNIENKPVVNERDTRPAPKPHFAAAAIQPPPPKPALTVLQPIATTGSGFARPRASVVPASRVPRVSAVGGSGTYQPFALSGPRTGEKTREPEPEGSVVLGLSEKEIDERIAKAVEMEVARRLEEQKREWELEERRAREVDRAEVEKARVNKEELKKEQTLPSGILTPFLKRHRDLDDELKTRLQELERKFERGNREVQLADVLSPISKKKTGRAYVALARAHSEKGDLQVALDLYRKAESYVPDNVKLKERIIEIEWAVKNNRVFVPSPKPPKKPKGRKNKSAKVLSVVDEGAMNVDEDGEMSNKGQSPPEFGVELINTDTPAKGKRPLADSDECRDVSTKSPSKRQRRAKAGVVDGEDEWIPPAPSKKGKRKAALS